MPGLLPPLHLLAQFPSIFALQQDVEQDQIGELTFQSVQTCAIEAGLDVVSCQSQDLLDNI